MAQTVSTGARRCIYSSQTLVQDDAKLRPSHEHIVPLSLGGSDQFTTDDVCSEANSRAGNEIDDKVAGLLPFLMARHRYGLKGNRGVVPNVVLKGELAEVAGIAATLDIDAEGKLSFAFQKEQEQKGQVVELGTTEDRIRFLLKARLKQARQRDLNIFTKFGQVRDEEDIEIALLLADRTEGKEFKAAISFDLDDFHYALARLTTKVAIGLGHLVLGPEWTFSAAGDLLRTGLWVRPDDPAPRIRGSISDQVAGVLGPILDIAPDKHTMAVLPGDHTTVAVIALFGGEAGIATIDLGVDRTKWFEDGGDAARGGCAFEIPLDPDVRKRRLVRRSFQELANAAASSGTLTRLLGG